MTQYDDYPNEDERRLAGQLALLAHSKTFGTGFAAEAIGKALALNRIKTIEGVLQALKHLTPLEFGGQWLYKQSVIETVEGAVDPW